MREARSFRLGLFSFGDLIQKRKNPLRGYFLQFVIPELFKKSSKNQIVCPDRILSRMRLVVGYKKPCGI